MMQNPSMTMTPQQMQQAHQYAAALNPGSIAAGRGMMPGGMASPNMSGVTPTTSPWAAGQQAGGIRPMAGATPNLQGTFPAPGTMMNRWSTPQGGAAL
jgi:hypothetical protein